MAFAFLKDMAERRRTLQAIRAQGYDVHRGQFLLKEARPHHRVEALSGDDVTHNGKVVGIQTDRKGRKVAVVTSVKAGTVLGG